MRLWRYGRELERLGRRYRLDGVLGSGGMADVCLAWDEREQHEVAIKLMKPDQLEQVTLDRFLKEAAHVARWQHPNIVRIYGEARLELVDPAQGSVVPYIVMEYAQGGDLHKRLRPAMPYPLAQTLHIFAQLCSAVNYAHEQGVIHRDLKPMNVLFRRQPDGSEVVALSDFGLAVEINATHFTFANGGTPSYMAPEQLRGKAEAASDIFALGVILYQLCTGQLPFQRTFQEMYLNAPLPIPQRPGSLNPALPPALDKVIVQALASDPHARYATAMLFWQNVQTAIAASPPHAHLLTEQSHSMLAVSPGSADPLDDDAPTPPRIRALPGNLTQLMPAPSSAPIDQQEALHSQSPLSAAKHDGATGQNVASPQTDMQVHANVVPSPSLSVSPSTPMPEPAVTLESVTALPVLAPSVPMNVPQRPTDVVAESATAGGPEIIDLGMPAAARKRDTTRSPTYGAIGPTTAAKSNIQRRNSARMAAAGMGAGAVAAGQRPPAPSAAGATGRTPRRSPRRRRRPVWLIVLLLLLLTLLIFGVIAAFVPGLLPKVTQVFSRAPAPASISLANITITPDSKLVPNSYVVRAVTDNPDPNKRQVGLNILTFSPPAQTKAVVVSGHSHIGPKAATGQITLSNGTSTAITINPTEFDNLPNGMKIITDAQITIPAGNPPVSFGQQVVSAHALIAGSAGNIAALTINRPCCVGGITAKNLTAFTGGQDASDYTFLTQSDVSGAANPLVTSMAQQAKDGLKGKLKANEQFAQDPTCTDPNVTVDQKVGDQGFEVKSANVTVSAKCTGLAFDTVAVQALVKGLLQNDVGVPPGYKLAGDVVTRTSVTEVKPTFATLLVQAVGRWYAAFGPDEEKDIATHIQGLSTANASAYLKGLKTISDENITLRDNGTALPADPAQISFTIKTGTSATAADLPAAPPGIPVAYLITRGVRIVALVRCG